MVKISNVITIPLQNPSKVPPASQLLPVILTLIWTNISSSPSKLLTQTATESSPSSSGLNGDTPDGTKSLSTSSHKHPTKLRQATTRSTLPHFPTAIEAKTSSPFFLSPGPWPRTDLKQWPSWMALKWAQFQLTTLTQAHSSYQSWKKQLATRNFPYHPINRWNPNPLPIYQLSGLRHKHSELSCWHLHLRPVPSLIFFGNRTSHRHLGEQYCFPWV